MDPALPSWPSWESLQGCNAGSINLRAEPFIEPTANTINYKTGTSTTSSGATGSYPQIGAAQDP